MDEDYLIGEPGRGQTNNNLPDLELSLPVPPRQRLPTIEPAVFLIFFTVNFSTSIYVNNLLYQICIYDLKEDRAVCQYLGTANESALIQNLETAAEKYSSDILMVGSICTNVFPAIGALFLGPWSDKFGRKPILLFTVSGFFLQYASLTVITYLSTIYVINPWINTLTYIPIALTGGYCALLTGLFCYITDITEGKDRASKMVLMEGSLYTGLFFGSLCSSSILNYINTTTVFGICAVITLLTLLYIWIYVEESVVLTEFNGSKLRELFRLNHIGDMFEAAFRRRPDWCRLIIWFIFASLMLAMFTMEGAYTVFFLFVREKFGWTIHDYAIYDSMSILAQVLGTIIGIFVLKRLFKISDPMLAVIAMSSMVLDSITKGVAHHPVHLYLAIGLSLFKSIYSPMARSVISSIVPNDEIGKLFALITSLESLSPLIASPLYSKLYKNTITVLPSAFNFLSAGIFMICNFLVMTAYVLLQGLPQITYTSISN